MSLVTAAPASQITNVLSTLGLRVEYNRDVIISYHTSRTFHSVGARSSPPQQPVIDLLTLARSRTTANAMSSARRRSLMYDDGKLISASLSTTDCDNSSTVQMSRTAASSPQLRELADCFIPYKVTTIFLTDECSNNYCAET